MGAKFTSLTPQQKINHLEIKNTTKQMKQRLKKANGRDNGFLNITLTWDDRTDLDIALELPIGKEERGNWQVQRKYEGVLRIDVADESISKVESFINKTDNHNDEITISTI